jgi:hypothetical protein
MGKSRFQVRSKLACLSVVGLLALAACGGGTGDTVPGGGSNDPKPTKTPAPTATPDPFALTSNASQINFQAATGDILLETISEEGFCLVNQTTDITAIVGDFQSRPISGVWVAFYVARGRGLIDFRAQTDAAGIATVTFRNICSDNFTDPIALMAFARGAERFTDLNSNGRFDPSEPFIDSPEEFFVDGNFNDIYEPELDEFLVVDKNNDGQYQAGGNGVYDSDKVLGARTIIVPTGGPEPTTTGGMTTPTEATPIPPTATPQPLDQITNASQIELSPADVTVPMFDESGRCLVNQTREVSALVGDFRGRPIEAVRVSFFVESGIVLI